MLIKSVLIRIKSYLSQWFLIPKKVMRKVEAICRAFLWNTNEGKVRRGFVS